MPRSLIYPLIFALVLLFSVGFQTFIPIASDEAYFIAWGKTLVAGVYDHPPLPGWVSFGLRNLGALFGLETHGVLHRIFALMLGGISLWLVGRRVGQMGGDAGPAIVTLALLPGSLLLFNLYLNDTLLAFFALLFLLTVEQCFRATRNVPAAILLAGLAFAGMLLTKYNGAMLFLGMVLAFASWPRAWSFLFSRMFGISVIALIPFAAHLWWNWQNCSVNLAFNFAFRGTANTGFGPIWLLVSLVFMAGPLAFMALWHARTADRIGFFTRVFFATLVVMLAISIWRNEFGVNWAAPLGFMAVLALAEIRPQSYAIAAKLSAGLSALILLPLLGLLMALQLDLLRAEDLRPSQAHAADRILDLDNGYLMDGLRPLVKNRVLAVMDYGTGASFDNAGFDETIVISRSVFGRNQDLMVDFRVLDGRDMVLLPQHQIADTAMADALFDSYEIATVETDRRSYQVILGQGFSYQGYRENWILPVIAMLYGVSPVSYGSCYMDKYR